MAHTPRNYQVLRDDHARALDASNQHIEPSETPDKQTGVEKSAPEPSTELSAETQPDRPSKKAPSPAMGMSAGMEAQNTYAQQRFEYNNAQLALRQDGRQETQIDNAPTNADHEAAKNELHNHVDRAAAIGNNLEPEQGLQRPAIADAWDAWEARIERNETPQRGAEGNSPDHEAAKNELNQAIDGQERGGQPVEGARGEPSHEAAKNELNQAIDGQEHGDKGINQESRDAGRETLEPDRSGIEI